MATFKDLDNFFKRLDTDFARRAVPRIIAENATEFYKERFSLKVDVDGKPWLDTAKPVKRGSLMVRSGALMASVKPSVVTEERVRISAGSTKVPYAKPHNEGEIINIPVTPQMRKFAWAMNYKTKEDYWKGLALTKKQTLTIKLPKRQFMGHSNLLNDKLMDAFRKAFGNLF
jgi:phage gpG-like protein